MSGVNKVILLGRLGKDPEVSYTQSNMAICKFSMATSEKRKGEEVTQWHRCVAFDKTGETISRYVKKGDQLYIEGKLQYGQYDNKEGQTVYTTDVVVNQFSFVSTPDNEKTSGKKDYNNYQQQQDRIFNGKQSDSTQQNDDIPF